MHLQSQRLFVEIRLLHQPVRHPPQQVEMRSAALIAARPQPDVVGQQQRDAAFAERDNSSSGLPSAPFITGGLVALRVSTVRKNRLQCGGSVADPFETARHRMAFAGIGKIRVERLLCHADRLGRQHRVKRRTPDGGLRRVIGAGGHQHRAALRT